MPYEKRTSCAYGMMYLDAMWWVVHRTDIFGVAKEMCFKSMIVTLGTILEAVLRIPGEHGFGGGNQGVKPRLMRAYERGWIGEEDRAILERLWDHRNNIHAHVLAGAEFGLYTVDNVDQPRSSLGRLVTELNRWHEARG